MTPRAVDGPVRVLEVTAGVGPAGVAARLLADLGAEVVRWHPPSWDPLAQPTYEHSAAMLHDGVPIASGSLDAACGRVDVVLVDRADLVDVVLATSPRSTMVCAITPFGTRSPWRDVPASELGLQAATGLAHITGFPEDPPTPVRAPVATHLTGMTAALSVLAALRVDRDVRPHLIDVGGFDAVVANLGTRLAHHLATGVDGRQGNWYWMAAPFSLYTAADGDVMICVFADRQWSDLLAVMGRSDLHGDPRFADSSARAQHHDEVDAIVAAWAADRTVDEVVTTLAAADVPAGPVTPPERVLHDDVLRDRGVVVSRPGGELRVASPVRSCGLGSDGLAHRGVPRSDGGGGALSGVKVLEVGVLTAGPFAGRLLADLGADVVKLEVPGRGDPARAVGAPVDEVGGAYFHLVGAGKRSLALDLRDDADRARALALADEADVVIENLGPGVLGGWGFGASTLQRRNPGLIYCTVSGFGRRGGGAGLRAYDGLIQARSGVMGLVRRPGRPPTKVGCSIADQVGGLFAAVAVVGALHDREVTGRGAMLDVAMHDVLVWMLRDALVAAGRGAVPPIGAIQPEEGGAVAVDAADGAYWPVHPPASCEHWPVTPCRDLAGVIASEHNAKVGIVQFHERANGRWQLATASGLPEPLAGWATVAPALGELADDIATVPSGEAGGATARAVRTDEGGGT